jgi:hypothetical protein
LRELHADALTELVAVCTVVPAELGESIGACKPFPPRWNLPYKEA